jgi:hypothetical protein
MAITVLLSVGQLALAGAASIGRQQKQHHLTREEAAGATCRAELQAAEQARRNARQESRSFRLGEGPEAASALEAVQSLADAAGLTIVSAEAGPSNTAGRYSYTIQGHGPPGAFCSFVAAVEQHDRLIVVEGGRLTPGHEGQVAFELSLATHHRGEGR